MDEVIELAEKLSRALARSRRFQELRTAEKAVMGDPEAVGRIRERETLHAELAKKEKAVQPIEPEEKRRMADLDEYVRTNPKIGALWKAQADFQEMMNLVNEKVLSALGPSSDTGPAGGAEAGAGDPAGEPPAA